MAHVLRLEDVRLSLKGSELLRIDAEIAPGEVLTVMGNSGSGKSTLLAFIAGFLDPVFQVEGRVLLDGEVVSGAPPESRRIGLLFQDPLLFPHLSVAGNLAFGLASSVHDRRGAIAAALMSAGLEGFEDRDPATLSGGQQARVALLRVLLSDPRALLLDEPFSKLDRGLKADFRRLVFERVKRLGLPTVLVSHDEADAPEGGRVVRIGGD